MCLQGVDHVPRYLPCVLQLPQINWVIINVLVYVVKVVIYLNLKDEVNCAVGT